MSLHTSSSTAGDIEEATNTRVWEQHPTPLTASTFGGFHMHLNTVGGLNELENEDLFGALGPNDDVRLCNEMCNSVIHQRGAVM